MDINKIISIVRTLKEEGMIANVVGDGSKVALPPTHEPGVRKKRPTIIGRGKFPGARKRWMER